LHQVAPNEYREVGSGLPLEEDNLVDFHLLYEGTLHVDGDRAEKHNIRKTFHSQLKHFWHADRNLRLLAERWGRTHYAEEDLKNFPNPLEAPPISTEDAIEKGLLREAQVRWNKNSFDFLPLVTASAVLRCKLDILFLRAEDKDFVLQGGDIDGRLKTLFDGLRMIRDGQEFPPHATPDDDEHPFFCLLENDDLVSEVSVKTGRLLTLPGKKIAGKHDVYLQITVTIHPTRIGGFDTYIV
jgi:hypothetical protein